ncbi:MAG: tetratricopeptide repeat protein [Candidatus Edwardsbacteria bacterium]|nr:tetratricopeptide repeat protein [Candidatus Edwardsbacteria bacterium]
MSDYYSLLGVRREASTSEITATYRNILREKFQEAGYSFLFSDVTQAYRTLSNPQKRKDYDLLLQKVVGRYIVQNPDNPTPADKKYQSGLNAIEQKRFQAAVDFFTQAIKIDPEKSHFYSQLGLALGMFNGRLAEAERYCKKAIELEPDNPELCYNLGFLYQRHNLVDAAQQAFLQAQQAEQDRWGTVFNPGNAVIELQWTEDEEKPAKGPEPNEDELPGDTAADKPAEAPELANDEPPETTEPAPADLSAAAPAQEDELRPAGGAEELSEVSEPGQEAEPIEPLGAAPEKATEDKITDDFEEPIILNDGPPMKTADTESWTEEIKPGKTPENITSQTPAVSPKKSSAEPKITIEPIQAQAPESGDQVSMAQIIDDDQEYPSPSEADAPGILAEIGMEPAGPEAGFQNDLEIASNAVDDAGPDRETLTEPGSAEPGVPGEESSQAEDQVDYGMVVDAVSPQAEPARDSDRDDALLRDLASLEAELAGVDASSGIGSGDNGLLMEMKGHREVGQSPSTDAAASDKPWLPYQEINEPESTSLDDLEDEALNLLRELGLNPSEYIPEDGVKANPNRSEEEAEPADTVEQSEPGDSEAEAEPDHSDLEELKRIEEMERKMAEELDRLKQEREKLKKRKKKK